MVANRKILITGGTGKVGTAIVNGILTQGGEVALATRNMTSIKETIKSQNWSKDRCQPVHLDLTRFETFENIRSLNIDAVIHCARSLDSLHINTDLSVSRETWMEEFNMGIMAPYEISRILWATGCLRDIIFISSIYGIVGPTPSLYENFEASSPIQYGVTKAAQIHMAKELAVRFRPVRVNAVSYGGFEGRTDAKFKERYAALNPADRMLLEEDVYGPIDMILNHSNMAFTGQNIVVDGGWTTW